jgi:hypothetical protein
VTANDYNQTATPSYDTGSTLQSGCMHETAVQKGQASLHGSLHARALLGQGCHRGIRNYAKKNLQPLQLIYHHHTLKPAPCCDVPSTHVPVV